jgi:hypothetical protein
VPTIRMARRRRTAPRWVAAALAVAALAAAGCTGTAPPGPGDRPAAPTSAPGATAISGAAAGAAASLDGRGVWLVEHGWTCRLREVGLDGRARRPPRPLPCHTGLVADTPAGLLAWSEPPGGEARSVLLDRGTGRVLARHRYPAIHGVAGHLVLWGEPGRHAGPFTLVDRRTEARHRAARPTPHGRAGLGLASPDGRLLAVEFADPSFGRTQSQVSDIWLLDLRARRWRRLPGMPLATGLKLMTMAWTGDGRLVLAGEFDRFGDAMVTWRPGQDLAVKRVTLPDQEGWDAFVAWTSPGR